MDNLFKYLPRNETINKRIVCKLWHQIGTKRLMKFIDDIEIDIGWNIENFLQMDKGSSIKFTNFAPFYWDDPSNPVQLNAKETVRLFDECGSRMKKVTLNLSPTTTSWKFLWDVLINKAPNMEILHIMGHPEWQRKAYKRLLLETKPELKLIFQICASQNIQYSILPHGFRNVS